MFAITLVVVFQNAYEKMYKRGTLTAMKLLTATEQTKPELTQMLSRSLWMRMWSKVREYVNYLSNVAKQYVNRNLISAYPYTSTNTDVFTEAFPWLNC